MEELLTKPDNDSNINTLKLHTLNKMNWNKWKQNEVKMQIFKSKVNWSEEGEKIPSFSYHLKTEILLIN